MKTLRNILAAAMVAALSGVASLAFAGNTPMLSVNQEGANGNYRITVNSGPSYSQVNLYRRQTTTLWTTITNVGQTDGSGYFSTVITLERDNTSNPIEQYVVVGGQQSQVVQTFPYGGGCYSNCGSGLTLSQSNINLNVGQTSYVTANVYSGGSVYISSNSNPGSVSASASGNQVTLYGLASGSSTVSVCSNYPSGCSSVYVTVSGSNNLLSLSQNNVSLNAGQTVYVTAYNVYQGTSFYVSSNTNSYAVEAAISGNSVSLYGKNSGSSNVTVCNGASCGTIYVTVNGATGGSLSLSQTSVNLNQGQSASVTASNYGNGSLYVSSNSNSSVVSVSLSGSNIYFYAQNAGSSTVTVCASSSSQCGTIYVTVGGTAANITLSQNSLSLNTGQTGSVTVYGGSANSYYISSNSNSNVVSASFSGNTLYVYGQNNGNATLSICQSGYSCASLYVTVYGVNNNSLTFQTGSLPQSSVNQYYNYQIQVSGGNVPYSYYLNSGSLPQGLNLSASGQIYGTPTVAGTSYFSVRVNDAYGRTGTANLVLTVSGVLGGNFYGNGQLVNDSGTVYIVYKNTKTAFASAQVFLDLGYKFANVVNGSAYQLSNTGYIIRNSLGSHPWGTWLKSGQTVYFVHESGLIPVPDYNTFINNGGSDYLVVSANIYDFQMPILPVMTANDYRLK